MVRWLLVLPAALLPGACGNGPSAGNGQASGPDEIIIQTGWYAQPETGGYYHAMAKGFYADEGLEVDVLPKGPGGSVLQLVSAGKAHFSLTRIEDLLMAAERGFPVVALSAYNQRSPLSLMVHADSPVQSFKDLGGRKVKVTVGTPFHQWLEGIPDEPFQSVPHDFGLGQFLVDDSLVQQAYVTNEPYYARKKGADVRTILFADEGYHTVDVLFTTTTFLEAHPETVRKVVEASAKGWYDFMVNDPSAGLEVIGELSPQLSEDYLAWIHNQMLEFRVVEGDVGFDGPFYVLQPDRLQALVEILRELELIPEGFEYKDHIEMRFAPASARELYSSTP